MTGKFRKLALAASTAIIGLSAQGALAQSVTMAVAAPVTSLDPHYHQLSPNNAVADTIFDKLVNTDAKSNNLPGLALSWRAVEANVWEFKLRPNVRFHNGNPFTAEDVAFTLQRLPNVPNSPSSFAAYSRPIQAIEIVDPLTIRFRTAAPHPLMPLDMTNVRILDRETHQNATTEDFNAGRAAIGTGPYRVVSHRSGDRIEFIDQVPTSDLAKLRQDNRIALSETVGLRLIFLGLDHLRPANENSPFITDNDGKPLGRNPLQDVRVRRALSIAIDRKAIVDRVMEGAAVPAGQFLPEGVYTHVPGVTPPPFDPDGARRLLAEAGYPQGFRIQLNGPNDRYVNDARIIQAVGQMWTRIGVRTTVEAQPWTTFVGRAGRADFSAHLIGWGSNPDGSHPLRNILATQTREKGWGSSNRGRYSNPRLDGLLDQSLVELDEAKRVQLVIEAQRIAAVDVAVIPLHIQTNIWGMRRHLAHDARNDELTRAQDVRPAAR